MLRSRGATSMPGPTLILANLADPQFLRCGVHVGLGRRGVHGLFSWDVQDKRGDRGVHLLSGRDVKSKHGGGVVHLVSGRDVHDKHGGGVLHGVRGGARVLRSAGGLLFFTYWCPVRSPAAGQRAL